MAVRTLFIRNILFLGIVGTVFLGAVILNASLPSAGFGTVLIVILAVILVIAGLFTGWGSNLMGADRRAVEALLRGDEPRTAHLAAASGVVRADGSLLTSPLTGTACVAYEYSIHLCTRSAKHSRSSRTLCYEGRHLMPTFLDGPGGRVDIHSLPSLEEFIRAEPDVVRARVFAEELEQREKTSLTGFLRARFRTNVNDYASLSEDWFLCRPGQWEKGIDLDERVLPEGVQVCAIGVWGDGEAMLCSPYRWRFSRISLEPGTPEDVVARIGSQAHQLAKVALWCLGAAAVLLAVMPTSRLLALVSSG